MPMNIKKELHQNERPPVVVVCGPTGIGKTAAAIEIALRFNGEIVGADAMQVYRRMEIGTAKPTVREQSQVRHHLIDVVEPDENCAAVGSGGTYALAAARALMRHAPDMEAEEIVKSAMKIAGEICVYTNGHLTLKSVEDDNQRGER